MMIAAFLYLKAHDMDGSTPTQLVPSAMSARPKSGGAKIESGTGEGPVLFFDGVCGLCNRFIDFAIRRDRAVVFRFAPLQGETAREQLPEADVREVNTMVLRDEQGVFRKSTAAVRVLIRLGGVWRILGAALWLVPRPLRDAGYSVVARYRYAIFGKKETCRMPTPAERARFLP
jgi:predicted DCC family thiol-disulfide oxidoreductase YuxK